RGANEHREADAAICPSPGAAAPAPCRLRSRSQRGGQTGEVNGDRVKRDRSERARVQPWSASSLDFPLLMHFRRQRLPGADKFADRGSLHLAHDAAAIELDGDLADAEAEGDLLVETSARHLAKDLTLACRERREPLNMLLDELSFPSPRKVSLDCSGHGVQQRLVPHRLREKVYRAQLHGLDS